MTLPHISIGVKNLSESIKFYKNIGYDLGKPIYCESLGGKYLVFGVKKGFPVIELVEGGEGIDHITVGESEVILKTNPEIIEVNKIPELGVTTKIFLGPDGERLELFT